MCKMIISPGFFQFFLILIFRAVTRLKGQKIAQNEKKMTSDTPYLRNSIAYDQDDYMIKIFGSLL